MTIVIWIVMLIQTNLTSTAAAAAADDDDFDGGEDGWRVGVEGWGRGCGESG